MFSENRVVKGESCAVVFTFACETRYLFKKIFNLNWSKLELFFNMLGYVATVYNNMFFAAT